MDVEVYNDGLTVMSVIIVIFGSWLVGMMLLRMKALGEVSTQDIASLTYVLSSVLVFLFVAGRMLFMWPRELTFAVILMKMVSVVAVTIWFRVARTDGVD